ncbi:hypothetical protein [Kitasatospora sp. NE20-6]|uniref:hypothetical protein n=1 Tax=Kitasatospora sp. NE20-6 TaxID=2859066 RepID=UPI0038B296FB
MAASGSDRQTEADPQGVSKPDAQPTSHSAAAHRTDGGKLSAQPNAAPATTDSSTPAPAHSSTDTEPGGVPTFDGAPTTVTAGPPPVHSVLAPLRDPGGAATSTPRPAPAVSQSKPAASSGYHAVGGAWCNDSSVDFTQFGWEIDGTAGWLTNSAGGYTGGGCSGKYSSVPMSGSATRDDGSTWAVWTFNTALASGKCGLSVYVPDNKNIQAVGGAPAYYTVQNTVTPGTGTIASFTVNQLTHRGQWVSAGTYPLTGGRISVVLHNRGVDWEAGNKSAHIAAAAIRADCT